MVIPQIIWCAHSSVHYIIESSVRYSMPLFLAIQLKDHLKKCLKRNCSNCVQEWVSGLGPADRMLVQVISSSREIA